MPGVYSKPPKRVDFFKDLQCIISEANKSARCGYVPLDFVHVAADAIQKERIIAREEAEKDLKDEAFYKEERTSTKSRQAARQLVARKEVEVAEAFFDSGAHAFFCDALGTATKDSPEVVDRILGLYEVLQLIEVDTFDDDIGITSILNFFLSERHAYYIDIHWKQHELSYMQLFSSSVIRFIVDACPASEKGTSKIQDCSTSHVLGEWIDLRTRALRLLYGVLWTFPPHRVVPRMALVFSHQNCKELLISFKSVCSHRTWFTEDLYGKVCSLQVLAAVAAFGLGPQIVATAIPSTMSWLSTAFMLRDERCPCGSCEFLRRLLKLTKFRDELGTVESSESKRQICNSLVRAGVSELLIEELSCMSSRSAGCEGGGCRLEFVAYIMYLCSWGYEEVFNGASILSAGNYKLSVRDLVAFAVLAGSFEKDAAIALLAKILENAKDATPLLEKGKHEMLHVVLQLILRASPSERKTIFRQSRKAIVTIAMSLCAVLRCLYSNAMKHISAGVINKDECGSTGGTLESSTWLPATHHTFDSVENALNISTVLYILLELVFDSELSPCIVDESMEIESDSWLLTEQALEACRSMLEVYEKLLPRFKRDCDTSKEYDGTESLNCPVSKQVIGPGGLNIPLFFKGLIGSLAVLVGGLSLQGIDLKRWRFVKNPAAARNPVLAGSMASYARSILSHYKKVECEGCQIIKRLANLVILRSEQAAGLAVRRPKQFQ